MARSKSEVALKGNTLPANWEAQMRADAATYKEAVASIGVGQFMSTRGGILAFQGTPVPGNKMKAVIVDAILANALYEGKFDSNNPQSPVCYAFGRKESEMAPHADSPKPQAESCSICPNNKFGSAEQGRGKACKNGVRQGIVHADSLRDPAGLKDAPIAILGVPPTSLPSWAQYVKSLEATTGMPPYGVVTEVALVPDAKTQFKLTFTLVSKIDKKTMGAVFAKHQDVKESIAFPYQPTEDAAPARGKKAAGKKPAARPAPAGASARKPPPPRQAAPAAAARPARTKF